MNVSVLKAYANIGRIGINTSKSNIDLEGYNYWNQYETENPYNFLTVFNFAVDSNIISSEYLIDNLVTNTYNSFGRYTIGFSSNNIDQEGFDYWKGQITSGNIKASEFKYIFSSVVQANTGVSSSVKFNPLIHVVAYGDSTTKLDPEVNIITYTQMYTSVEELFIENKGIPSTTVSDLINGVDTNVGDVIVLNYGLNEAYRGYDVCDFQNDLITLVQDYLSKDKVIILQTPNKVSYEISWASEVYKYAEVIRQVSIDNQTYLQDKFLQDTKLIDGIHPTNTAYETQAIELAGILNSIYDTYIGV